MKLTKNQFCTYVDTYQKMIDQENQLLELLNMNPEWAPSEWLNNYYEMLRDLCELPDDPHYGNDLDWFCFECDFGRDETMNKIYSANKSSPWYIKDSSTLYDFIMRKE